MTVLTVQRVWRIMDACGANAGGGGSLRWRRRRGRGVIAEKGFKGAGGDREGFEGKKGARGFDERSGVRVTWR